MSENEPAAPEPAATPEPAAEATLLDELAGPDREVSLVELAHCLGGLRRVELSGHVVLGRLSGSQACAGSASPSGPAGAVPLSPAVAVWASGAALAHAWRAEQLASVLPVSTGLPSLEDCTDWPGTATAVWAESLSPETSKSWYGLLRAAYERRRANAHPSAEEFVSLTLDRLLADLSFQLAAPGEPGEGGHGE